MLLMKDNINIDFLCLDEIKDPLMNNQKKSLISEKIKIKIITSTIVFIKKVPNINCKNISSIKKDFQELNFSSEGNNNSIFQNMHITFKIHFILYLIHFQKDNQKKSQNLCSNIIQKKI